jgi:hypothetical protein
MKQIILKRRKIMSLISLTRQNIRKKFTLTTHHQLINIKQKKKIMVIRFFQNMTIKTTQALLQIH